MGMKFLEIEFQFKSPAIVTSRRTATGFLTVLRYIPASTLRGATISGLYRDGTVDNDFLERESKAPQIISSPAYPVVESKRSYPSHPFTYECKIPHEGFRELFNYANEVLPYLERGLQPPYKTMCPQGHIALKPLHPDPVVPDGHRLKKVSVYSYRTVCVGISKHRAASEKGMLFEYEAIAAGQKFWSKLAVPDALCIKENMEFMVGRGISRGFGRAVITSVKEVSLDERESLVKNAIKGDTIILYAISQTVSTDFDGNGCAPYPESIDLQKVAGVCGFTADGKLSFYSAYGRAGQLSAGWDMLKNVERPTFYPVGNSGTVLVAKLEKWVNATRTIAALEFLGTIEITQGIPIVGVNMLVPLRGHPMEG